MKNKEYLILSIFFILVISFTIISIEVVLADGEYRTFKIDIPECNSVCPLIDDCSVGRLSGPVGGFHHNNPHVTDFGSCERFTTGSGEWFACMPKCREEKSKNMAACKKCRDKAKLALSSNTSSETSTPADDKDETLTDSDARIAKLEAELDRIRGETFEEEDKEDEEPEPVEKIKPKLVPKTFGEPFKKLTFSKGQIEMLRGGKVEKITKDIEFQVGDIIHTGDDGGMEIATEDGTVKVDKDTTLEFVGLKFDPVPDRRVTNPPLEAPWALDRSVRYEIDNEAFWDGTAEDIKSFVEETNIDLEIIGCLTGASIIGCMSSAASVLHSGSVWFEKEIKKDFGVSVVITPKNIFFPDGTEFSVDVADDGSTTVTVFDGRVVAIDRESKEIEVVGVGEQLTTGLEVTTIDLELIDKWWIEEIAVKSLEVDDDFGKTLLIFGVLFLISVGILAGITFVIKKKSGTKTKAWGIGSLVLGILGISLSILFFAGLALSLGAIYFYTVQKKINPTGPAKAGLILGFIGTVLSTLFLYIALFMV